MDQFPLPLSWPVADSEDDFLVSDSNREAFDHLRRWSLWPVMATILTGPRKSGRSLLGRIFARNTGGQLFDNAEEHDEEAIFHAWNDAQQRRKPLLLIAEAPPPLWPIGLPDLRSRLTATPHVRIQQPDDGLMSSLIVKLLGDRGIAPPPELSAYLMPRIERSFLAIQQVVDLLDQAVLSNHRRMTMPLVRKALEESGMVKPAATST